MGQPPSQGTGGPNRWLVGVPGTVPSLDYERTSRGSDCKKKQNLQLRNEAQLYSAALRSSLQDERAGRKPEGMAEESSFLDFVLNESSSRRGGWNVGIAKRFPRWVRNPQGFACTVISTALAPAAATARRVCLWLAAYAGQLRYR